MNRVKISGFSNRDNLADEQHHDDYDRSIFSNYIGKRYEAKGSASNMLLKTTRELQYEARDMCVVSVQEVVSVMEKKGF